MKIEEFRHALLEQARREAAAAIAESEAQARSSLEEARRAADRVLDEARREGREQADRAYRRRRAQARRDAREAVLRARREALDRLRETAVDALRRGGVQHDPAWVDERLAALARRQLGDSAVVESDPSGGVVAHADGRRVDYRLGVVIERAIEDAGDEVTALWR